MVADVSSSPGRGCRVPSSVGGGAHWGHLTPDQAKSVESCDREGSMEERAGGCVEQRTEPGGQRRRFIAPEGG